MTWDGTDESGLGAGTGIYIYVLRCGAGQLTKKMLLMDGGGGKSGAGGTTQFSMLFKPAAELYNVRIAGLDIETLEQADYSISDESSYDFVVTRKDDMDDIILPGAGVPGAPVSENQRQAAFADITQTLNAIKNVPDGEIPEQLARHLAEQPEIEIAGYGEGGAWARFTDGRMIVFDSNIENIDITTAAKNPTREKENASVPVETTFSAKSAASSWTDIPQSKKIALYQSHASESSGWLTNLKLFVEQPVDESGNRIYSYTIDGGIRDASVDAFMNIPGDCAVFAIHCHASNMAWNRLLEPVFAVYTSTPVTASNEIKYWNLLQSEQLVYYHPILPANLTDLFTYDDQLFHYAFTAKFVDNYWAKTKKFESAKTFVYFNVCSGFSVNARPMIDAIFKAGASLYAGWTYRSFGQDGPATASYIFDRLLGSNLYPDTMNDPHRPFSWDTLHDEMISLGYGKTYDDKYGKDKEGDAQYSWLIMEPAPNSPFKLLAPSIKYMDVDEKSNTDEQAELTIYGIFGDTEGEVFIKKEEVSTPSQLSVKNWTKNTITCYLQPDDYGDVSVKVNGNRSNLRPLSKWEGKVNFTVVPNPAVPNQASCTLQDKITWDITMRADVAPYRESKPEEQPAHRTVGLWPTKESITSFFSAGSQVIQTDSGPVTVFAWTGDGIVKINDSRESNYSRLYFELNTGTKISKMDIVFIGSVGSKTVVANNGLVTLMQHINTSLPSLNGLYDEVQTPFYKVLCPFDDAWRLIQGEKKVTLQQYAGVAGLANAPVTIKWDSMPVENAPLDDQYHGK